MNLHNPITYINGISNARAMLLADELGIVKCIDLLHCFPFRYIDKTQFYKINQLIDNDSDVQVVGLITQLKTIKQKRGSRLVATFQDETGTMELVWFRGQKWFQDSLKLNQPYVAFGKLNSFNRKFSIPHPELELLSEYQKGLQVNMINQDYG